MSWRPRPGPLSAGSTRAKEGNAVSRPMAPGNANRGRRSGSDPRNTLIGRTSPARIDCFSRLEGRFRRCFRSPPRPQSLLPNGVEPRDHHRVGRPCRPVSVPGRHTRRHQSRKVTTRMRSRPRQHAVAAALSPCLGGCSVEARLADFEDARNQEPAFGVGPTQPSVPPHP
jgi:hypothetical protein